MSTHLQRVAGIVLRESGICVRPSQLPALQAALRRVQRDIEPDEFLRALEDPERGPMLLDRLIDAVSVNETYFLRNRSELELIDWSARLASATARGSGVVQVWNPACATGEESYTVAMLALEALGPDAPVSILGTDIARGALERAKHGSYGKRSVRKLPPSARERYFRADGEKLSVAALPRQLVRFTRHNLVGDPIPPVGRGPFDVIVCRNVLIYFEPATATEIAARLASALAVDGTLVLGAADTLTVTAGRPQVPTASARGRSPSESRRQRPRHHGSTAKTRRPAAPRRVGMADRCIVDNPKATQADVGKPAVRAESPRAADELDPVAYFVRGLAERAADDAQAAIASFRRALYAEPGFARCAFELGRTHETIGDLVAAQRSYLRALDALTSGAQPDLHLESTELADLVAGCKARLRALRVEAVP